MLTRRAIAVATVFALSLSPAATAAAAASDPIPPGTRATLALKGWLSSKDANVGDTFETWLVEDITVEGKVVVPAGAIFVGRVAEVKSARALSRGGELTLVIDKLVSGDGRSATAPATISGVAEGPETDGSDNKGKNAGIGGAIGGTLGAIVGGTTGLLVGLVVGAGGGLAAGRGKEVELPEGTHLQVKFNQQVDITWTWMPKPQ